MYSISITILRYLVPGDKSLFEQVDMQHSFENKQTVDLKHVENSFGTIYQRDWNEKLHTISKLRTYVTVKSNYESEKYLKLNITKNDRSHLSQFRCAVLPLKIETGRFSGLAIEDRLCQVCDQHAVESEIHFLLYCHVHVYNDLRKILNQGEGTTVLEQWQRQRSLGLF